jgi:EmrB/QacA subfamily drug resistance transporter
VTAADGGGDGPAAPDSAAASRGAQHAGWVANPKRWRAMAVTQLAGFMSLLDVSIVNVALPSIEREMAASPAALQWVVSGYALTYGLALVPAGRLGDMLGRRRMFLIALAAFVVTSAITGAAPTAELLIGARLLQGIAGGMLAPQNSGLIQEMFRGAERGRAFGILGATIGLATAAGPIVGGLILAAFPGHDGWRWVFYVNVPIGLVALVLAARLVPAVPAGGRREYPDPVGALLLGGGVASLLLPVVEADSGGLRRLWWLFAVAILLLAGFARWETRTVRRGRAPLLNPRLVHVPGYIAGMLISFVYFMGFTGVWLVFALFLQDGLGFSPLRSGLSVTPFALGSAISAVIAGILVPRFGRWLTIAGLAGTALGLATTALVLRNASPERLGWAIAGPLLLAGLGGGMVTSPNITLTLESVPVAMAGAAGGTVQTAQRIGSAIGTATLAAVFYAVLARTRHDYRAAISVALLCTCGFMLLALMVAAVELTRRRIRAARRAAPAPRPEHLTHHM